MPDADYWRAWRAAHPEYREREAARGRQRKRGPRPDRRREYDRANAKKRAAYVPAVPIPVLYAKLRNGQVLSFWNDELAMDVAQERALAECEGRDPERAANLYIRREMSWFRHMTSDVARAFIYAEEHRGD